MAKRYEEDKSGIESNTVGVYRTAATVKGGRRFSFSGMVVCGDRKGQVGLGYGKANQVPNAIEKAQKKAKTLHMELMPPPGPVRRSARLQAAAVVWAHVQPFRACQSPFVAPLPRRKAQHVRSSRPAGRMPPPAPKPPSWRQSRAARLLKAAQRINKAPRRAASL